MKVLIIEDEPAAARQLKRMIKSAVPAVQFLATLDSVDKTIEWFEQNISPDLAFFDIQLSDGLSFDIFQQTTIKSPVIFTTAYDQYSLKAFKVNSVDYLLKPIDPEELTKAMNKYKEIFHKPQTYDQSAIAALLENIQSKKYKERGKKDYQWIV